MKNLFAGDELLLNLAERGGAVVGMDEINKRSGQEFVNAPAENVRDRRADALEVAVRTGDAQKIQ